MKRIKLLVVISILALAFAYAPMEKTEAQSNPNVTGDLDAGTGYKAVATQTVTVTSATAVILGTIPVGCHSVDVIASADGDINYGPSTISTGTNWPYIPAGTVKTFDKLLSRQPTIYFRARGGTAPSSAIGIIAK